MAVSRLYSHGSASDAAWSASDGTIHSLSLFRQAIRLRWGLTLLLAAGFLIPGLVGHDPWKQDETYTLGLILHILHTHDWVVPTLTGQPFMEKPPLYYIVAAQFVRALTPLFSMHDAARLTSGFCMILTLASLWLAASAWGLGRRAPIAVLAFISCLGLLVPAHTLFTDVALLSGFCIAFAGFSLALRQPLSAGLIMGTGVGIGFMTKGLLAPGIVGVTALGLPALFRQWRTGTYFKTLSIAFITVLPWILIWPLTLYHRSPDLFMQWFWQNNIGRYEGFSVAHLGAPNNPLFWWKNLPWFTFPALPMALYSLWQRPRAIESNPMAQFGVVSVAVIVMVLSLAASARANYALPILFPLALLAASYRHGPEQFWRRQFWWAAVALFGVLAVLIWGTWFSLQVTGHAPAWAPLHGELPADYHPPVHRLATMVAATLTLLWLGLILHYRRHPHPLLAWVGGLVLGWGLVSTILLPWINDAKSYQSVFIPLEHYLPAHHGCIANMGLGESERAMLQYYAGVITLPTTNPQAGGCRLLVVEKRRHQSEVPQVRSSEKQLWNGHRDGDNQELFWLYSRVEPPMTKRTRGS